MNYVDTQYAFNGNIASTVKFSFTTTTWSNSYGFSVRAYEYVASLLHNYENDTILDSYYVSKYDPSPVTHTFTLNKNKQYIFIFYNLYPGENIVGSGNWTLTER